MISFPNLGEQFHSEYWTKGQILDDSSENTPKSSKRKQKLKRTDKRNEILNKLVDHFF